MKKILTLKEKDDEEEAKFIQNQEKALTKLKKICEVLKGKKITENCYQGEEVQSKSDIDVSKSSFTPIMKSYDNTAFNWNGLNGTMLRSLNSH